MPITLNGTTGISVPLGSVSVPSLSNTTDTTTGLYFPASNALALGTGGTVGLYLNSSQQVGIKTSTPAYPLDVNGTANFPGTTTTIAAILKNAAEPTTVSATAASGTVQYDVTTQSVLYYTSNASANWTLNIRGNSTTSIDSIMSTGQSVSVCFFVTQGATAYYASALTVDGVSVTPKYQGGSAWTSGNVSSIDAYVYTLTKTGSATFTVFASQTQFK